MSDRLLEHLKKIHGMTVLQTSPESLHQQDHSLKYSGYRWEHSVDDLFLHVEDYEDEPWDDPALD